MYRVNEGLMRKAPIFILAAPRSFSTITAAILGGHPQAYSVPELNLLIKEYSEGIYGTKIEMFISCKCMEF